MKKHGPSKGCNVDENVDELVIVVKKAPVQMNLSINLFDKKKHHTFLGYVVPLRLFFKRRCVPAYAARDLISGLHR